MNDTKTVTGYITWGIYTLLICTLLTLGVFGITADYQITDMAYRILCAGLFFLLLFGVSYFIYSLSGQFVRTKRIFASDGAAIGMIASATVFLFLGAFVLRRLLYSIAPAGSVLTDGGGYFKLAMLTQENTAVPWIEHIATYVYTWMLRGMCMMFGNIEMSAVLLHAVLLLTAAAFLYFAVRSLIGKAAAFVTILGMTVMPYFTEALYYVTPLLLLVCITGIALFVLSLLLRLVSSEKLQHPAWCLAFICYGILMAGLLYLDVVGIVLLIVSVVGIVSTTYTTKEPVLIQKHGIQVLFLLLGTLCGLGVIFGIRAYLSGTDLLTVFRQYSSAYSSVFRTNFDMLEVFIANMKVAGNAVFYVLAALFVTGFWFADSRKARPVIVFAVGAFILRLFMSQDMRYAGVWNLGIILLAALGIQTIADYRVYKCEEASEYGTEAVVSSPETAVEEDDGLEIIAEEMPRFIENPLPLPKKHVPKTMGYAVDSVEGDYDIAVDEADDFDIK